MCKPKRKSVFLLLLCFSFSLSAFSQDGGLSASQAVPSAQSERLSQANPANMTDAEIVAELMSNLTKREATLKAEKASFEIEKKALEFDRKTLTTDKELFEKRKQLLIETEAYWKNYKKDTLKDKLLFAAAGFAAGFGAGNYTGFKIGVTVKY